MWAQKPLTVFPLSELPAMSFRQLLRQLKQEAQRAFFVVSFSLIPPKKYWLILLFSLNWIRQSSLFILFRPFAALIVIWTQAALTFQSWLKTSDSPFFSTYCIIASKKAWTVAGGQCSFSGGNSPNSSSIKWISLLTVSCSFPEISQDISVPFIFSVKTEAERYRNSTARWF